MTHHRDMLHGVALGLVAALGLSAAGCDFSVTNPGPILDGNLDSLAARRSVATGARRALADILGGSPDNGQSLAYWVGAETFEVNPAGSTGSFGIPTQVQVGWLRPEENTWSGAQRARWVAEDGIRRFTALGFAEDSLLAALHLWAGYSDRLLGENFCDAVFDGGPKLDFKAFFARADSEFTEALRIATNLTISAANRTNMINAARAGRASVRMYMAYYNYAGVTWAQATADAGVVTTNTYTWVMPFYDQDQNQYNAVWHARSNSPYRAHTNWGTYYENYYRTTKDPRVPWDTTTSASPPGYLLGDAAVSKFKGYPGVSSSNRVPFFPEAKYKARTSPVILSSGWEMRLIEAEFELAVNNNAANAVAKMNLRRTAINLATVPLLTASTVAQAWTDLKRERMLEFWLEGRRLGDIRRWSTAGTPGFGQGTGYGPASTLDGVWLAGEATPREHMGTPNGIGPTRDRCFPIGKNEVETNPNLQP